MFFLLFCGIAGVLFGICQVTVLSSKNLSFTDGDEHKSFNP